MDIFDTCDLKIDIGVLDLTLILTFNKEFGLTIFVWLYVWLIMRRSHWILFIFFHTYTHILLHVIMILIAWILWLFEFTYRLYFGVVFWICYHIYIYIFNMTNSRMKLNLESIFCCPCLCKKNECIWELLSFLR